MGNRKQSLNDQQIISRVADGMLPISVSPNISGNDYIDTPLNPVSDGEEGEGDRRQTLQAPRNLELLREVITFAPDGTQYVTVTLQFDLVEGAEQYEYRIAKI